MANILQVPGKHFNRAYAPCAQAMERYQLFYGGAGSGKSAFVASRVAVDALIGRNTLVVRQVADRIRNSCYNEIIKAIRRMGIGHLFVFRLDSITCACSGAQILFSGLDDAEKVKSVTPAQGVLTDIWMEEATEIAWESFRQLDKRLRGESPFAKRVTMTFNPCNRLHWLYKHFFQGKDVPVTLHRTGDTLYLRTTYRDNAFLSQDDRDALEKERDAFQYAVYTKGEWGKTGDQVLENWRREDLSRLSVPPSRLRLGLDFGFTLDPSAAIKAAYDRQSKTIYVLEELVLHGATNDVLAAELKPFAKGQYVLCDSAEPKSIAELRLHGIHARGAKKGRDSLWHSIQWLRQHTILVDPRCENFLREIEGWSFQKSPSGENTLLPRPGDDHLLDALRYALSEDMAPRMAIRYTGA